MKKFDYLGLWSMLRNPDATAGIAQADAVLDEFVQELTGYCRGEKDLAERTRTLRFTRCFLTTANGRSHNGAGKKCDCPTAY